jgi:hypothetical protein
VLCGVAQRGGAGQIGKAEHINPEGSMNRRRLALVRERPRPPWALEIVCTILLCIIVYLLSTPVLEWVRQVGGVHQAGAGGYTIVE